MRPTLFFPALFAVALLASGCASTNAPKADPLEGMNRATFAFNDAVDKAVLKPVAQGYRAVTPGFAREGVSNAFNNVGDVAVAANNLLQGKPVDAASDLARLVVNSTLGILGLFDVASPMGLEKHNEDFGQTLGRWGVGSGPYLVVPLMGPSTFRDAIGRPVDGYAGYFRYVKHVPTRNVLLASELIAVRESLLNASGSLEEASLDRYQFLRDAYLQRRLNLVYDGKAPSAMKEQLADDLEPPAAPAKPAVSEKPAGDKK